LRATRVAFLTASSVYALIAVAPASAQSIGTSSTGTGDPGTATPFIITNNGPAITPGPGSATNGTTYANSPQVLDPAGMNGVGQMIEFVQTSAAGASLGLCTGTLINPRTVITASHCVYDSPMNQYGSQTGTSGGVNGNFGAITSIGSTTVSRALLTSNGIPLSFGFGSTNRCTGLTPGVNAATLATATAGNGCQAETGAYEAWRNSGFKTDVALGIYNANQVWYERSMQPVAEGGGGEFANGDIALVTLDTHAKNIPTWTLLFSPLDGPTHATITGYGNSGVGVSPIGNAAGIDYRRRSAENMIDALMSWNDENMSPAIGDGSTARAAFQHPVYWIDFDDPNYHYDASNVPSNDAFIPQPKGTNPRTLYYDFNELGGGALPREGVGGGGDSGGPLIVDQKFDRNVVVGVLTGSISYDGGVGLYGENAVYAPLYALWQDIVLNNPYKYVSAKAGDGNWFDASHWVQDMDPNYAVMGADGKLINAVPDTPQVGTDGPTTKFGGTCFYGLSCSSIDPGPLPPTGDGTPLITAGGPGSTNFVPNNVEPVNNVNDALTVKAKYYDVTLDQVGKTTLSASATIDKLTIDNSQAKLDIASGGNLKVWAEFNQVTGWTNIDGTLKTDEAMIATGLLTGKGVFDPTYLTVVGAGVAPGGADKVATLTIKGDTILASASALFIDAMRGQADQLKIVGDADNTGVLALNGGSIVFNKVSDAPAPRAGESYVIATADGGRIGTFAGAYTFQGVLRPELTYGPNSITATLRAGSLVTILDGQNPTAIAFANALDQMRSGFYDKLSNLYGNVDWMNGAQLNATFSALSPAIIGETQLLQERQSQQLFGNVSDRLSLLGTGQAKGISMIAGAAALARSPQGMSPTAQLGLTDAGHSVSLPTGGKVSGFVSMGGDTSRASYGNGARIGAGRQSRYFGTGLEAPFGKATIGTALGYAEADTMAGQDWAKSKLTQAAAYASLPVGKSAYVGAILAAEQASSASERLTTDTVSMFRLSGATHSTRYMATAEAGFRTGLGLGLSLNPRAQLGYSRYSMGGFHEEGSETALQLNSLNVNRLEGRVGAKLDGTAHVAGWTVTPNLQADYVRLLAGRNNGLQVSFAAARDYSFALPLANGGSGWAEAKGGIQVSRGAFSFGVTGQSTVGSAPISDKRGLVDFAFKF
jgi:hypothetical protein